MKRRQRVVSLDRILDDKLGDADLKKQTDVQKNEPT